MMTTQLTDEPKLITWQTIGTNQTQSFITYKQEVIMKQEVMITDQ